MSIAPTRQQGSPMSSEGFQAEMILSQIESLPTLPAVAMRLIELTGSDTSNAREVIRLIESDPSIAARLLSLVNRAHLGAGKATTVDRAVVLLGFDAVRCLVLSMQVFEVFSQQAAPAKGRLDIPALWRHGLAVGCAARLLAEEWNRLHPSGTREPDGPAGAPVKIEEAFLCGLLHDLGKAALYLCFPKSYDRVIQTAETTRGSILDEERSVFGLDHTTAGRRLATHWKLPAMIGECIWLHHHDPASTPTRIAFPHHVHLVQLADRLARQMHLGHSGNFLLEPAGEVADALGFSREVVDRVTAALPDLIEERAELIGLDRLTTREVYHGALAQANAELGLISSRLLAEQRALERRARCLEVLTALSEGSDDEPTHEQITQSAARGLLRLYPGSQAAVLTCSEMRGLSLVAVAQEGGAPTCQAQPLESDAPIDPAGFGTGWVSAARLRPEWLDRLTGLLGRPPCWCWAIRQRQVWLGGLCLTGSAEVAPESDAGVDLLAVHTARWLSIAESAAQARLLHEELADINRRLVSAQAQVAQMRSLAMVGEMAAGAAHELNNPLAVISGRAQLLNREGMSEEVRKNAGLISEHAHRASQMVSELMEFAKPPSPSPDAIDLARLLAQIREAWIGRGDLTEAQFQLHVSDDQPRAWADESQIRILFDELIRNAVEAMGGTPQALVVVNCQTHPTDDKVVIRVQDNGRGMSAEVLERAAAPFYSSRPAGRGRGLGLSRAVRYAEINGGRIRLSSRPGHGTQVMIELPRAANRRP